MAMDQAEIAAWEAKWASSVSAQGQDTAHDFDHVRRVVANAKELAALEHGRLEVILPAAWLHDLVTIPKGHPNRSDASRQSAQEAVALLEKQHYPAELLPEIAHCIEAHSFSAGIEPRTREACIVQDADRLDALGAIGIARCFATAGELRGQLYHASDPFARNRELNDALYALDHFETKLFRVGQTLRTPSAKKVGESRVAFMRAYLTQLRSELAGMGQQLS